MTLEEEITRLKIQNTFLECKLQEFYGYHYGLNMLATKYIKVIHFTEKHLNMLTHKWGWVRYFAKMMMQENLKQVLNLECFNNAIERTNTLEKLAIFLYRYNLPKLMRDCSDTLIHANMNNEDLAIQCCNLAADTGELIEKLNGKPYKTTENI